MAQCITSAFLFDASHWSLDTLEASGYELSSKTAFMYSRRIWVSGPRKIEKHCSWHLLLRPSVPSTDLLVPCSPVQAS